MMLLLSRTVTVVSLLLQVVVGNVFSFSLTVQLITKRTSNKSTTPTPSIWASTSSSSENDSTRASTAVNVLGTSLDVCCSNVRGTGIGTGFYRDGCCTTGEQDIGRHTVCVQVNDKFLEFSKKAGNDLSTPVPQYMFPGLKDGDLWCLCAQRWVQAYEAGMAPKLYLRATHEKTLTYVPFEVLLEYAIDRDESEAALEKLNQLRARLNKLL